MEKDIPGKLNCTYEFQVATIVNKLKGYRICIGVKKLLGLLDMVKQMEPQGRLIRFLNKLEEENFAVPMAQTNC